MEDSLVAVIPAKKHVTQNRRFFLLVYCYAFSENT